jgi:phosphoribosylpyrophosphate synthetase
MKKLQAQITIRLVAALLVTAAVIGLSTLATHAPTQNQTSMTRSLKSIQTDKTTLFYTDNRAHRSYCVEMVLPGTGESKAATENLKLVAATL